MKIFIFNQKKQLFKEGFTLVEVLTSVFIIVLITGIFLANYQTNNQRTDLIMTAQKLVSDLRLAQNNALGLVKYGDEFPSGGWALNFDITSEEARLKYIIFADLDSPASNEPGREAPADYGFGRFDSGEGLTALGAKTVDLPSGIIIESLQSEFSSSNDWLNVNFLPPDPKTNIFNGSDTSSWAKIILRDLRSDQIKTIFVNFLGLIEVVE